MIDEAILKNWFFTEIFPLDAALTRFIRRNWRNEADVGDLRQDIYARVYASASERLPLQAKPFLYITARNHLINCAKRAKIVSFEHVADLDALGFPHDARSPTHCPRRAVPSTGGIGPSTTAMPRGCDAEENRRSLNA